MTSYEIVINKFVKKIKQDIKFFMYNNLTKEEILQTIRESSLDLLESACDELEPQLDQISLSNRDDDIESFDDDLTRIEIDTISDMMKVIYMREPLVKLKEFQKYLGTDINAWSPANERKTYLQLLNDIEKKMEEKIDKCNYIDRNTGKSRSLYD